MHRLAQWLTGPAVPQPDGFVQRTGEQDISARIECDRGHVVCMMRLHAGGIAALNIPNLHIPIVSGCDQPPSIRAEARVTYLFVLAKRLAQRHSSSRIPHARRVVRGCGNNNLSIGTEFSEDHSALVQKSRSNGFA